MKKLAHLMKYLIKTRNIPLILGSSDTGIRKWWIDTSLEVHPNIKGHTRGGMSTRKGFLVVTSTKHNLKTQISIEAEVVGLDDCMPEVCWTHHLLEAQD